MKCQDCEYNSEKGCTHFLCIFDDYTQTLMTDEDADWIEFLILNNGLENAIYEALRNGYKIEEIKEIHQEMLDAGWNENNT